MRVFIQIVVYFLSRMQELLYRILGPLTHRFGQHFHFIFDLVNYAVLLAREALDLNQLRIIPLLEILSHFVNPH